MVTKLDYNVQMVKAAHAVLLELVHVLGEYRDGIALVGGWVPNCSFLQTGRNRIQADPSKNHFLCNDLQ